jgi:hypothetical protein
MADGRRRVRLLRWLVVLAAAPVLVAGPAAASSPPENVVFWYQGAGGDAAWGRPLRVVSEWADPSVIHAHGATAWFYGQMSWFPDTRPVWNGTTAPERAGWRLCRAGYPNGVPGRHGSPGWWWADPNEQSYADAMVAWARSLRNRGWDGLFLDSTGYTLGGPEQNTVSTCTEHPVVPGANETEAFENLAARIHTETGLGVAMNSPPDAVIRAGIGTWLSWFLRENVGPAWIPPGWTLWQETFDSTLQFGQAVEMGKSLLPEGAPGKSAEEVYTWARAKLAGQPVVVDTGNDQCPVAPDTAAGCLRMGVPTDLIDVHLGAAIGPIQLADCDAGTQNCIMWRRFRDGLVAVNMAGRPRQLTVDNATCHRMYRQRAGLLFNGACVTHLSMTLGTQRAWIITYKS